MKNSLIFALLLEKHINIVHKNIGPVVQLVRIHACHAWGRGFESRPDRLREALLPFFFVMVHTVYILQSETLGVYYKGYTQNLEKRLWEHNNGLSRFTKGKGPWKLVFSKAFDKKREALIC